MADLLLAVTKPLAHAAQLKPQIEYITTGVSYMTAAISSAVAFLVGAGLGWYVKGRGMAGVQIDLNNVKTDVENLKAKLSAPTPAA